MGGQKNHSLRFTELKEQIMKYWGKWDIWRTSCELVLHSLVLAKSLSQMQL